MHVTAPVKTPIEEANGPLTPSSLLLPPHSITHHTGEVGMGQAMLTDDVSLRVFMEHLMKLAVQTP